MQVFSVCKWSAVIFFNQTPLANLHFIVINFFFILIVFRRGFFGLRANNASKIVSFGVCDMRGDIIWRKIKRGHLGSAILVFLIFSKINERTLKWSKQVKVASRKWSFFIKKRKIQNSQKKNCLSKCGCRGNTKVYYVKLFPDKLSENSPSFNWWL